MALSDHFVHPNYMEIGYFHSYISLQVIVVWTANTERYCDVKEGLNTTAKQLLMSIAMDKEEVSPSTIFAVASILEGVRAVHVLQHLRFVS